VDERDDQNDAQFSKPRDHLPPPKLRRVPAEKEAKAKHEFPVLLPILMPRDIQESKSRHQATVQNDGRHRHNVLEQHVSRTIKIYKVVSCPSRLVADLDALQHLKRLAKNRGHHHPKKKDVCVQPSVTSAALVLSLGVDLLLVGLLVDQLPLLISYVASSRPFSQSQLETKRIVLGTERARHQLHAAGEDVAPRHENEPVEKGYGQHCEGKHRVHDEKDVSNIGRAVKRIRAGKFRHFRD